MCLQSQASLPSLYGNIVETIEDAYISSQTHSDHLDGYIRLSDALFAIGDHEKARTIAREGITIDLLNSDLKDLLGRAGAVRGKKSFAFFFLQQLI